MTAKWAVTKAYKFDTLSVFGHDLPAPENGPQRFIPVFDTREQAEWFAGKENAQYVAQLTIGERK
jgi:hypothetical protein